MVKIVNIASLMMIRKIGVESKSELSLEEEVKESRKG
jgi:hypothetical protein